MNAYDKPNSILASRMMLDAVSCLAYIVGLKDNVRIGNKIKNLYLNTKERVYASIESNSNSNSNSNGQTYTLANTEEEEKSRCNFNPDNI